MEVKNIAVADIAVPVHRMRAVDPDAVSELTDSIKKVGLRLPITVQPDPEEKGKYVLVTGAHRHAAYAGLNYPTIPAVIRPALTVEQAEMEEITENLHRKELSELERSEQTARWIELVNNAKSRMEQDYEAATGKQKSQAADTKAESAKSGGKGGKGNKGGINEAARVLPGVTRSGAQRAVKVAKLSKEAKAKAKELKLHNNQSALLEAAKGKSPEDQVKSLEAFASKRAEAAEKRAAKADETPVDAHARQASQFVDKIYAHVNERVQKRKLVRSDVEGLIEHLQSLAEKTPKDRAGQVRKLEAERLAKPAEAAA